MIYRYVFENKLLALKNILIKTQNAIVSIYWLCCDVNSIPHSNGKLLQSCTEPSKHNWMEIITVTAVILIENSQGESLGLTGMQNLASFIYILSPIYF